MQREGLAMVTPQSDDREPREFSRLPAMIPVRVEVAHVWEGATFTAMPATLFNMSRGGAGLRLQWVVPPRTRLLISLPTGTPPHRLLAEVVRTPQGPGREPKGELYGIRWLERLSPEVLESVVLQQGFWESGEEADAPRT